MTSDGVSSDSDRSADQRVEALDHLRWLPILLLVLLPFAIHLPLWLLGLSTDPMWFYSGVSEGSHLLPGYPFLDPNAGFTSQALGHLAASDWIHGIVPWWNSYTGIGMPLAGELQPEAFFLPFNLLLLLPGGVLWQQIMMQIIAGLATYALLRELELSRLAALMGAALFALNGTIAWTPGPAAVYCSLPFLSLLLWGIERARRPEGGAASVLAIGVAIAWSILAGFPEPAYISGLMALSWALYRLAYERERWVMARRAILGFVLGMMVAAPLLISFVDYLRQSNSFGNHAAGERALPWAAFSTTLMPYVYGPLGSTYGSQTLGDMWGCIGGYAGVLLFLMAVVGVMGRSRHRGLRALLAVWIVLTWAKTFGVRPVMAVLNHLPLLKQAAFFRYAPPSWELAMIILAAIGLDDLQSGIPQRRQAFGFVGAALAGGVALATPQRAFWHWPHSQLPMMSAFLLFSLAWALAGLAAAGLAWKLLRGQQRRTALASLLVLDAAAMFLIAQSSAVRKNQIDVRAIQFLQNHQGLSRTYTLGPLQPNYGAFFQVANIDHNVLPRPDLWTDHVERDLLPGFSAADMGVTFWPGVMREGAGQEALSQHLKAYLNVGVRYVITNPGQSPMPTTFLPAPEVKGAKPFVLAASGPASRLLGWSHLVMDDPKKPAIIRWIGLHVVRAISSPSAPAAASRGAPTFTASQAVTGANDIELKNGDSASVDVTMPATSLAGTPISEVGVMIGNYGNTVDGALAIKLCSGEVCQSGQRPLSGSPDNSIFQVALDQPLLAPAGALHLILTHIGGSQAVALRTVSGTTKVEQQLRGPAAALPNLALHLSIVHGLSLEGLRKVYADSVMDIWELPGSAPYFQVIQGGPCSLKYAIREDVTAVCASPATLLRRELYMPGWDVKVNGHSTPATQRDEVFQSTSLPTGRSQALFHFAPPYVNFGWAVCAIGIIGLLGQVIILCRARQRPVPGRTAVLQPVS